MPAFHRLPERGNVHYGAPGRVQEEAPLLHLSETGLVKHPLCLRRQRNADGNVIALSQQLVQRSVLRAVNLLPFRPGMAAVVEQAHIEGPRAPGKFLADAPEANDAQRAVLRAEAHLPVPDAAVHLRVLPFDVSRKVQYKRHQVLCHGALYLPRGTDDRYAQPAACVDIDRIVAYPSPRDQFQVPAVFQQFCGIALEAGDHGVRIPDIPCQFFAARPGAQFSDGCAVVKDLKPGLPEHRDPFGSIVSCKNGNLHMLLLLICSAILLCDTRNNAVSVQSSDSRPYLYHHTNPQSMQYSGEHISLSTSILSFSHD